MPDHATLSFPVKGMHCGSCVGRIEKVLAGLDGVEAVRANLASQIVTVDLAATVKASVVVIALKDAGYPAQIDLIRLSVEGMSCASCVGRVQSALEEVEGVLAARVNLATHQAVIEILAGTVDAPKLADLTTKAGYAARLIDTADQGPETTDQQDLLKRDVLVAAALTFPVVILEMGGHLFPAFHHFLARIIGLDTSWTIQFVLTSIVLLWPGRPFFRLGIPALLRAAPDMNSLVSVGTFSAWAFSTVALFVPAVLPASSRAVYFEAAAVIVTLILLGRYFEARAKGRAGEAIRKLVNLRPATAMVKRMEAYVETPIAEIGLGDLVQVRAGERIAVDGQVTDGASYVDESMLSGEAVPVRKMKGAEVIGGSVNGNGALEVTTTRVGNDTMLAQIIRLVESAQVARLPIESLVNRITLWFVPAVMIIATLAFACWLIFGPSPALNHALVAGVSVLIIACPCAMGLATPTSIIVGTGRAAELGVLFRQGEALQRLETVTTIAFDKTGTLTEGRPELTDWLPMTGFDSDQLLAICAAVEAKSEHPLAKSIVSAATARGLKLPQSSDHQAMPGLGVSATVEGKHVMIGSDRYLQEAGIDLIGHETQTESLNAARKTVMFAAVGGQFAAIMAVSDPVKKGTADVILDLQRQGLNVAMISGDAPKAAQAVADVLNIKTVIAGVLPGGKVAAIDELRSTDATVAFVGDGINDAPALAHADVSLAIGTGTDIAIEAADIVLMSEDLKGVQNALKLSRATMRNIRQNLFWAFGYNILLIPVAAGLMYPFFELMLSPLLAAGAMALSSVFVVTNALRLRWIGLDRHRPPDGDAGASIKIGAPAE